MIKYEESISIGLLKVLALIFLIGSIIVAGMVFNYYGIEETRYYRTKFIPLGVASAVAIAVQGAVVSCFLYVIADMATALEKLKLEAINKRKERVLNETETPSQ